MEGERFMPTSNTTMSTAGQAVAGTFELLEQILEKLDTRSLTCCQLVSRQFAGVVDRSQILQQNLFLVSAEMVLIRKSALHESQITDKVDYSSSQRAIAAMRANDRSLTTIALRHPAYTSSIDPFGKETGCPSAYKFRIDANSILRLSKTAKLHRAYITQPPIKEMTMTSNFRYNPGEEATYGEASTTVKQSSGVTFGDIKEGLSQDLLAHFRKMHHRYDCEKRLELPIFAAIDDGCSDEDLVQAVVWSEEADLRIYTKCER